MVSQHHYVYLWPTPSCVFGKNIYIFVSYLGPKRLHRLDVIQHNGYLLLTICASLIPAGLFHLFLLTQTNFATFSFLCLEYHPNIFGLVELSNQSGAVKLVKIAVKKVTGANGSRSRGGRRRGNYGGRLEP